MDANMRRKLPALLAITAMTLGFLAVISGCASSTTGNSDWEVFVGYTLRFSHRGPEDGTEGKARLGFADNDPVVELEQGDGDAADK